MIEHPTVSTPRMDGAVTKPVPITSPPPTPASGSAQEQSRRSPGLEAHRHRPGRRWLPWLIVVVVLSLLGALSVYLRNRPVTVSVVRPEWRTVTETIAASGIVGGYREVTVGSQAIGVVSDLRVVEGQRVARGSVLAVVQNRVASAQVAQAQQALATARAQLAQQAAAPLASEVSAARSRVAQAKSTLMLQRASLAKARATLPQADAAIAQALAQVDKARHDYDTADSQRNLQQKTLQRYQTLFDQGFIPAQQLDQQQAAYKAAVDSVDSATSQVAYAQSAVSSARAGRRAAAADVLVSQANLNASDAAVASAEADLRTLQSQPRQEPVEVARQQARNAGEALRVAQASARDTVVTAPFDAIVTKLVAQPGASTSAGIVRLVETQKPEIRCEIDENNLASLLVGLKAVVTSTAYPGKSSTASITRIGAQVDSLRGTTEVAVGYDPSIAWLRPGQTVDVNVITQPSARRLLIPLTAVRRATSGDMILVVKNGRAVSQRVTVGPPAGDRVPVLSGLVEGEAVVSTAESVTSGARVKVKR